ncbi:MAG: Druantia anti-phage system protein DruA [Streptosporangiaceae bacterium]
MAELDGQRVAVAGFGPAALSCAARHRFIGWSREQQYARRIHIADNQRFCVLPGGQRHNLASAVLARLLLRLPAGYLAACGHRVLAVETFTDPARHVGACHAGANFRPAGQALGYGRSARDLASSRQPQAGLGLPAAPPRAGDLARRPAIPFSRARSPA